MPYRNEIRRAISGLLAYQNDDGGIADAKGGDPSGEWTTAGVLDVFLGSAFFPLGSLDCVHRMVQYLIASQRDDGGWRFFQASSSATIATGHALVALQQAQAVFQEDEDLTIALRRTIAQGFVWLEKSQNADGGWGVEPGVAGDGQDSRIISTYYVLLAYCLRGATCENSRIVRDGTAFVAKCRNPDGSWGAVSGLRGDVSNTARAGIVLLEARYCSVDHALITAASRYLLNRYSTTTLWDIEEESFLRELVPGQFAYFNNCTCDAVEFLLKAGVKSRAILGAIFWLLQRQEENGIWQLSAPSRRVLDQYTWATAEWIHVMDMAARSIAHGTIIEKNNRHRWAKRGAVVLFCIISFETLYLFGGVSWLLERWLALPEKVRDIVITCILIAIPVGIISQIFGSKIEQRMNRLLRRPGSQTNA